jgi:ABC-type multidrug transport system ATPase subunit
MKNAILSFRNLRKSYAGAEALTNFTLDVGRGACFGVVGVNGAGKTTLIKCLLDFCDFDSGEIYIDSIAHRETSSRAQLAFLPERFNPPYFLTGRDFLEHMSALYCTRYDDSEARNMFAELGLEPAALDKTARDYSKGMTQKLGLAACFLSGRELLVLDEPSSGLDPRARVLLKRKLAALREAGRTIFFTSHALADVEEMCDQVAVIHDGKLRFAGTPAELAASQHAQNIEQAFMALTAAGP